MKTFYWNNTHNLETKTTTISLIENTDDSHLWIWGILHKEGEDQYRVAVRSKDRLTLMTIEELLPQTEAKLAVEKQLFDIGVIQEEDVINDYTIDP